MTKQISLITATIIIAMSTAACGNTKKNEQATTELTAQSIDKLTTKDTTMTTTPTTENVTVDNFDETLETQDTVDNSTETTTTSSDKLSTSSTNINHNITSNKPISGKHDSNGSDRSKNNTTNSITGNAVAEKDNSKIIQANTTSNSSEVKKLAQDVINKIITKDMGDFDKAKAIHDYMIINIDYDYENYLKDTIPSASYTALGALKNKYAVCAGYAKLFQLMCQLSELECIYVVGDTAGGSHAWNQVKINGKWYNVDTTWDDPVSTDKKFDDHKFNRYSYFLISDDIMYKDHTPTSQVQKCSDSLIEKAYETPAPWQSSSYTKVTNENEIRAVVKKAIAEDSTAINVMFDTNWVPLSNMHTTIKGIMLEFVDNNFSMGYMYHTIKNTTLVNVTFNITLRNGKYTKQEKLTSIDDIKELVKYLIQGQPYEKTIAIDNNIANDKNFYDVAVWAFDNLDVSIGFSKSSIYVSSIASAYHVYAFKNDYHGSHHANEAYHAKTTSDILTILSEHYADSKSFRIVYRYGDEIGRLSTDEAKAYIEKNMAPEWANKYCYKSYDISVNDFICVMVLEFNYTRHNTSGAKWEYSLAPTCIKSGISILRCIDCHNIVSSHDVEATGVHDTYWVYDSDITKHLACKNCTYTGHMLQQYGQVWGYFDATAQTTLFNDVNKRREIEKYIERDYMGNFVAAHDLCQLSWNAKLSDTLRTFAVCQATAHIEKTTAQALENSVYTLCNYPVESLSMYKLFDSFKDLEFLQNPNFKNAGTVCFYFDYDGTGLDIRQVWAIAFSE